MKSVRLFFFTFASVVLLSVSATAQTAKDVSVVNPVSAPVPVRAVDDPAKRAFQLSFEVNSPNTATTPAGKIFVVEHVSGSFRLGTVSGSTNPCRFFQLALPISGISGPVEQLEMIPTVMGTATSIGQDITLVSINHSMKFYIRPNMEIGGVNYLLGGSCTASPLVSSRMVLSGYLVDQ